MYALADGRTGIATEHLDAACAVRAYARSSAEVIWGDALGDDVADRLLIALRRAGTAGMDRTAQRDLFGRHVSAKRLGVAREYLGSRGRIVTRTEETGGRPRTLEVATEAREATDPPPKDGDRSHSSLTAHGPGADR